MCESYLVSGYAVSGVAEQLFILHMEGYLRIGYANNPAILTAGLPLLTQFLARADQPMAT